MCALSNSYHLTVEIRPDGESEVQFVYDGLVYTLKGRGTIEGIPTLTLYSQRDPRWRNEIFAGDCKFGRAGCYVVCVAMIASLAGFSDDPLQVAQKLQSVGAFIGCDLTYPERIPRCYPRLQWHGRIDWRNAPADIGFLKKVLARGPTIIEVDFNPGGALNQHFVVGLELTSDERDLIIADPWDGTRTRLMERYARKHWDLARAIYGIRQLQALRTESGKLGAES